MPQALPLLARARCQEGDLYPARAYPRAPKYIFRIDNRLIIRRLTHLGNGRVAPIHFAPLQIQL